MKGQRIGEKHIQWHLKRRQPDGKLNPCVLLIEKGTGVIVSEKCEEKASASLGAAGNGTTQHLEQFGIPYELKQLPNGQTVIEVRSDGAPRKTKMIMQFFNDSVPCYFAGCEEVRREYKEELKNLGEGCRECDKGEVMRSYMGKLQKLL